MAAIGQVLTTPESGWKRYDADLNVIQVLSGAWEGSTQANRWNSTFNYIFNSPEIKFDFTGTKLRLISDMQTENIAHDIYIDDLPVESFTQVRPGSSNLIQALVYEKLGLEDKRHSVRIKSKAKWLYMDAIDVDSTGSVLHPTIKTRLEDMVIGDKMRCEWFSQNGSLNSNNHFYKIGTSVFVLGLPGVFSQSTASGFYFIYVGNDFKDRMILIADRNVSHTISWDQLNTMGYAAKDGIEITSLGLDPSQWKTNIRLLTGGTSSTTTGSSEWDKYIVNGPVGSDNATWNWSSTRSWTSTTPTTGSTYKTVRGVNSVEAGYYNQLSSNISDITATGFRPVLVAESLAQPIQNKYLIQDGNEIKTFLNNTWSTIGAAPATKVMFDQGLSVSSLTVETLQQLNSSKPELLCWTDEVNPTRHVTMTGDMWEPVSQELPTVELFTEQGMKDLRSVPSEAWNALRNDFDVVTYTNLVDGNQAVRVQATPYAQLVFAETDFSIVEDLTITGASDGVKIIVSGNGGVTWKTYDSQWVEVNANLQEAKSKGMTIGAFNALTKEMWALIGDNIRLAYYIENEGKVDSVTVQKQPSSIQTPSLDRISITYDELTIEGRLKDLEEMNAINLMKLQFKANALMQASKYTLHDLVVDTFETDTAITTSSDSSQIIPKSFNDPVPLEDGFISEITLDEFSNFTGVTIS